MHTFEHGKNIWCLHDKCTDTCIPIESFKKLKRHMREVHNQDYNLKKEISPKITKRITKRNLKRGTKRKAKAK